MAFSKKRRNYTVSSDKNKLDVTFILDSLRSMYWAQDLTRNVLKKSIKNSHCFGLYHYDQQIGFARVMTDYSRSAYLSDVFIDEAYRGKGLSKFLISSLLEDPALKDVSRWMLATKDAHGLYRHFGFGPLKEPENYMQLKK